MKLNPGWSLPWNTRSLRYSPAFPRPETLSLALLITFFVIIKQTFVLSIFRQISSLYTSTCFYLYFSFSHFLTFTSLMIWLTTSLCKSWTFFLTSSTLSKPSSQILHANTISSSTTSIWNQSSISSKYFSYFFLFLFVIFSSELSTVKCSSSDFYNKAACIVFMCFVIVNSAVHSKSQSPHMLSTLRLSVFSCIIMGASKFFLTPNLWSQYIQENIPSRGTWILVIFSFSYSSSVSSSNFSTCFILFVICNFLFLIFLFTL